MSTQTDSIEKHRPSKHLEVFSDLRTYPSQWDVSELSADRHKRNQEPNGKATCAAPVAPQEDPQYPEVSFSDWHLGVQLDQLDHYDALDTSHFSAL